MQLIQCRSEMIALFAQGSHRYFYIIEDAVFPVNCKILYAESFIVSDDSALDITAMRVVLTFPGSYKPTSLSHSLIYPAPEFLSGQNEPQTSFTLLYDVFAGQHLQILYRFIAQTAEIGGIMGTVRLTTNFFVENQ